MPDLYASLRDFFLSYEEEVDRRKKVIYGRSLSRN